MSDDAGRPGREPAPGRGRPPRRGPRPGPHHRPGAGRPHRRLPRRSKGGTGGSYEARRNGPDAPAAHTPTTATRRPSTSPSAAWSPTRAGAPTSACTGCSPAGRRSSAARSPSTRTPESFADGRLVVRTDSTAWATQLSCSRAHRGPPAQRGARRRHRAGDRRARPTLPELDARAGSGSRAAVPATPTAEPAGGRPGPALTICGPPDRSERRPADPPCIAAPSALQSPVSGPRAFLPRHPPSPVDPCVIQGH